MFGGNCWINRMKLKFYVCISNVGKLLLKVLRRSFFIWKMEKRGLIYSVIIVFRVIKLIDYIIGKEWWLKCL